MGIDDVANALSLLGIVLMFIIGFRTTGRRADGLFRPTRREWFVLGIAGICILGAMIGWWIL